MHLTEVPLLKLQHHGSQRCASHELMTCHTTAACVVACMLAGFITCPLLAPALASRLTDCRHTAPSAQSGWYVVRLVFLCQAAGSTGRWTVSVACAGTAWRRKLGMSWHMSTATGCSGCTTCALTPMPLITNGRCQGTKVHRKLTMWREFACQLSCVRYGQTLIAYCACTTALQSQPP